jgi:AcrR family transcriptional regulator
MSRRADPVLTRRRREALIKAGYAEILEKGVAALTIDAVVERAGSSKGGALHYFHHKDELLYAVLDWLLAELDRTLDDIARSPNSPRSRLVSELEVLFHSAEVNRKLYRVLFDYVSLGSRSERYRARLAEFFENCRRRDVGIVEEGVRLKQFRAVEPESAASTIRALVDGYCLQWLAGGDGVPLETYRNRCRAVLGSYLLR